MIKVNGDEILAAVKRMLGEVAGPGTVTVSFVAK